mgnify:CR=1 FL=1
MKQHLVLIVLVLMSVSIAARAQESDVRIGLGVSIAQSLIFVSSSDETFYPLGYTAFSVPIMLTKNFRIEPSFGALTHSFERTYTDNTSRTNSSSQLRIGAGLQYLFRNLGGAENVMAWLGPRVEFLPTTYKSKASTPSATEITTSQTNLILGLAVGGECFLAKSFSLGAEAQFNYISIGEVSESGSTTPPTWTDKESFLNIGTAITARVYFN